MPQNFVSRCAGRWGDSCGLGSPGNKASLGGLWDDNTRHNHLAGNKNLRRNKDLCRNAGNEDLRGSKDLTRNDDQGLNRNYNWWSRIGIAAVGIEGKCAGWRKLALPHDDGRLGWREPKRARPWVSGLWLGGCPASMAMAAI